jgi:hypothetical protein
MAQLRNLLLLGMIGTIHCVAAWGQACYTPIKSWQGSYTLNTNASGVTCPAGGNGVCNIGESSAANVSTILSSVSSCNT